MSTLDAFRELLFDFTHPEYVGTPVGDDRDLATPAVSLSVLLVALHNIVTDSIDLTWNSKRRQLFCAASVLADLEHSMARDVASQQLKWPVSAVATGALGIEAHLHMNCSWH